MKWATNPTSLPRDQRAESTSTRDGLFWVRPRNGRRRTQPPGFVESKAAAIQCAERAASGGRHRPILCFGNLQPAAAFGSHLAPRPGLPEENGISNRRFSTTFTPPLTSVSAQRFSKLFRVSSRWPARGETAFPRAHRPRKSPAGLHPVFPPGRDAAGSTESGSRSRGERSGIFPSSDPRDSGNFAPNGRRRIVASDLAHHGGHSLGDGRTRRWRTNKCGRALPEHRLFPAKDFGRPPIRRSNESWQIGEHWTGARSVRKNRMP